MRRDTRPFVRAAIVSLLALTPLWGCSPWDRLDVISRTLYEPLSTRDLNGFEQRLAHLKRSGATGDALTVATQWLYLLTCHPIPHLDPPKNPLWRALYASLYLEETRAPDELGHLGALLQSKPDALKLDPLLLPPELWMTWPEDVEGWPDEAPLSMSLPRLCRGAVGRQSYDLSSGVTLPSVIEQRERKQQDAPPALPARAQHLLQSITELLLPKEAPARQAWWRLSAQLGWATSALDALEELEERAPEHPTLSAWRWWLEFDVAQSLSRASGVSFGWRPAEQASWPTRAMFSLSCVWWERLQERHAPKEGRGGAVAYAQVLLMSGLCHEERGAPEEALALWRQPGLAMLDPQSVELVYYHRLRLLSELGMWGEAVTLREHLPPTRSPLYPAYTYALGRAHQNAGDEEGLMALSTSVFRDKSWRRDPFLRGLFYLFVRALTRYDFESRVIELLEDLGPRFETYDRVLVFAEVSLDEAQPTQAREAATWLLDHGSRGARRYHLHSLLAHAALLELDQARFKRSLHAISGLKSETLKAIPKGRRGRFFKERDLALTRLLQRLLPVVAEWPAGPARGAWLELMLSEIQLFLRTRPESRSRTELTALYRAGKSMLDLRSRLAYAEAIGRRSPASLVLGQVRVQADNVSPFEPREVSLALTRPWALTLLPTGPISPLKWSLQWSQAHSARPSQAK